MRRWTINEPIPTDTTYCEELKTRLRSGARQVDWATTTASRAARAMAPGEKSPKGGKDA